MTKFKGTRGEWFNDLPSSTRLEGLLTNACDVANEEGKYVATVYGNTPKICKANAKLIAAAPELIEALQDLIRYCEENNSHAELELAYEALNKALNQ